ncbi:MAG TPA: polysaccharide lyase family 8 super-sandwich domain-containing protein [Thermoanaerobaculia bacterium]|nr:polysaccharide lyase family 8 super-sandwich domain-containing protein [Thermoanaerobaculia bacterium]
MKHLLLAVATFLTATVARAADIDVVRQQFLGYATAAGADRNTPRMSEAIGTLEWVARSHSDALNSDGSWPDISYNETPDGNWGPWAHTQRLWLLAKAYQTPGQSFYRSPALLADINAALAHTKTFYAATIIPTGNWWFWTIGIPIDLGPTLVLMRGEVDPATFDDLVLAIHLRIGSSPTARGLVGPVPTGQNLVWSAYTHLCLGLLKNDEPMLAAVRDAMASVARPTSAEGIKRDRSFHQHGAQLYTGGYGGQFAADVARYALITRGTTYGLPSDALASFADYVADGIAWSLHGDYFDVSVISREVARPSTSGFNGMAALVQAAQIASPRAAEIRAAAAKILQTWRGTMNTELAGAAALVEAGKYSAAWPSGHRHYFASDYTIHRRPGWFASVKMFSTRTKSGEKTNDENLFGSRQSDGRFYLVLRGDEYFGRDVWPALDWTRLPGITVEQKADAASDVYGYGTRSFAGGTGDGRNGVTAMELAPLASALTAKKAWFFFDDAIVFLTNSIRSASTNRVETVVNQVSTTSTLTRHNDWAHLDNVGYWFPTPASLQTSRDTRSGTWASLGGSSDTTVHTKPFVTMVLDHGIAPVNATAEYVIVPNVTSNAMASWAAARPLSILANTDAVSAVRDTRNGNLGITFWRAASIEGIQSSAPAVVYLTRDGNTMHVWAADPNANTTGSYTLTIPGNWHTTDVPSFRTVRSITLTLPRNTGQTTHVILTEAPTKRRTVRR